MGRGVNAENHNLNTTRTIQSHFWLYAERVTMNRPLAISTEKYLSETRLVDAGCPVIQLVEPALQMTPIWSAFFGELEMSDLLAFSMTL